MRIVLLFFFWYKSPLCCCCTRQGEGNDSIRTWPGGWWRGVNQLPLSWGRARASGGTTGRRSAPPSSRRHVIHTQSPPNCITLASANMLLRVQCELSGFWQPPLPLVSRLGGGGGWVFKCCRRGFGVRRHLCPDSLMDSWLERLRVASFPTAESNPEAAVFLSRMF